MGIVILEASETGGGDCESGDGWTQSAAGGRLFLD